MVKQVLGNLEEYRKNFTTDNLYNVSLRDVAEVKLKEEREKFPFGTLEAEIKDGKVTISRTMTDGIKEYDYPTINGEDDWKRLNGTMLTPMSGVY